MNIQKMLKAAPAVAKSMEGERLGGLPCSTCGGSGRVQCNMIIPGLWKDCGKCGGTGTMEEKPYVVHPNGATARCKVCNKYWPDKCTCQSNDKAVPTEGGEK